MRWGRRTKTQGLGAMNFGKAKGCTFVRVLIFPTQPMIKIFRSRDPEQAAAWFKLCGDAGEVKCSVTFVIPLLRSRLRKRVGDDAYSLGLDPRRP